MGAVPSAGPAWCFTRALGLGWSVLGTGQGEAGQVSRLCILTEVPWEKELGCYSRAARGALSTGRLRGIG